MFIHIFQKQRLFIQGKAKSKRLIKQATVLSLLEPVTIVTPTVSTFMFQCVLETGLLLCGLIFNLLCSQGWPLIPVCPAFTSQMLGLQVFITRPNESSFLLYNTFWKIYLYECFACYLSFLFSFFLSFSFLINQLLGTWGSRKWLQAEA